MADDILYLYQDQKGHRVIRKNQREIGCHECLCPMSFIASVPREEGESVERHEVRALTHGRRNAARS